MRGSDGAAELGREQHQGGPEPLAACLHEMRGGIAQHGLMRLRGRAQAVLDEREAVRDVGRERCVSEFQRNSGNHVGPLMGQPLTQAGQS